MVKTSRYQRGEGIWGVVFILFLIGFVAFTSLKLAPVYIEDFSIASSIEGLETDKNAEYRGALSVRKAVLKRFGINNVKAVGKEDVVITRDGDMYHIDVEYEVLVPYIANVSLLLTFNHTASVRAAL